MELEEIEGYVTHLLTFSGVERKDMEVQVYEALHHLLTAMKLYDLMDADDRAFVSEFVRLRMNYFLNTSSKARKRLETEERLPAFRDQIILAALTDLLRSLFGKESFKELTSQEQPEFMRQIRFRFSADIHQIARVCGLSYADAARIIDAV